MIFFLPYRGREAKVIRILIVLPTKSRASTKSQPLVQAVFVLSLPDLFRQSIVPNYRRRSVGIVNHRNKSGDDKRETAEALVNSIAPEKLASPTGRTKLHPPSDEVRSPLPTINRFEKCPN